ncbi:MAG: rod shape-determining protein MreD [Spirochaetaceae bacterium]|nr:rod shape-determining protein MreD [Spirochaetaceae bacterium]
MTVKTFFSSLVLMTILILVETALLSNIAILPAIPDLILLALLYISINNGSLTGEVSGFFSGLILDFLSAAPLGLNSLLRTIIGFFCGIFHKILNVDSFFIPMLLGFIGTVIKVILLQFISFFFPNGIITYQIFSVSFFAELIMNTLLAPLMFFLLSFFSSFLVAEPRQRGVNAGK